MAETKTTENKAKSFWRGWLRRFLVLLAPAFVMCYTVIFFGPLDIVNSNQMYLTFSAGSIAPADRLVRVMYKEVGVPLYDAVEMMSLSPAKMVAARSKGSVRIGKDADFVIFDDDIQVKSVITAGNLVDLSSLKR